MNRLFGALLGFAFIAGCSNRASFGGKSFTSTSPKNGLTNKGDAVPQDGGGGGQNAASNDELDGRLEREGAQSGEIQMSLIWNGLNDLDLHVLTPLGEHLFFGAQNDAAGGFLDVDMNAGGEQSSEPVENVFWSGGAPRGHYRVFVHHFAQNTSEDATPFRVRVKVGSSVTMHTGTAMFQDTDENQQWHEGYNGQGEELLRLLEKTTIEVHKFTY